MLRDQGSVIILIKDHILFFRAVFGFLLLFGGYIPILVIPFGHCFTVYGFSDSLTFLIHISLL